MWCTIWCKDWMWTEIFFWRQKSSEWRHLKFSLGKIEFDLPFEKNSLRVFWLGKTEFDLPQTEFEMTSLRGFLTSEKKFGSHSIFAPYGASQNPKRVLSSQQDVYLWIPFTFSFCQNLQEISVNQHFFMQRITENFRDWGDSCNIIL